MMPYRNIYSKQMIFRVGAELLSYRNVYEIHGDCEVGEGNNPEKSSVKSIHPTQMRLSIAACFIALMLSACTQDRKQNLNQYINEVKSQSIGQIEPLPEVKPYEIFTYKASNLRSPFDPPVQEQNIVATSNGNGVMPDARRRKEPLESYPIDSLRMVGTLEREEKIWAIVVDKDGTVHRITQGNYVGQNHGKITSVTEEKVSLTEIIPDGRGGWRERQASMTLVEEE